MSPSGSNLQGASRPSTKPRLHSIQKPYSRVGPYGGPESQSPNGRVSPIKSTRSSLPTSNSLGSLHGAESRSTGWRSYLSRPLGWLASPAKAAATMSSSSSKRDSLSSFGNDVESSGEERDGKRLRRHSPELDRENPYAPKPLHVEGRAVSGFMLPPLPPHVSLSARNHLPHDKPLPNRTNFSRPLTSSASMPYLDPPSGSLASPSRRRNPPPLPAGGLARSRHMDLSTFGYDDEGDDSMEEAQEMGKGKGKAREMTWSPWKERTQTTPSKRASSSRLSETRDHALPSRSPFQPPPSPLARRQPSTSALPRSTTASHGLHRSVSMMSDVSMGRESARGLRASPSMRFANGHAEEDDSMSVDGDRDRVREGSVLDWYMRNDSRSRAVGSPASAAASRRLGSATPGVLPIRKGQMVWDAEKGFVRESELKAVAAPKPIPKNDAERILQALEEMRTPLEDARKGSLVASSSNHRSLPVELIGASSRQIRKAVNVPLATAQAGETARKRREKERLSDSSSVMISPYGRRRQADRSQQAEKRERKQSEMSVSQEFRPSRSGSASTASQSQVSDDDMEERSEREPTPPPAPTPRRSSRNRRTPVPEEEAATPRARKTRSKATVESTTPKETPRNKDRKGSVRASEKQASPPPAPVPTITETAPSPSTSAPKSTSTYSVRNDGELPRESSSLRARNAPTSRRHEGAASYHSSRSTTPTNSGRFSAREEDLPQMEELEKAQAKINLPSFAGITFSGTVTTPKPLAEQKEIPLSSRISAPPPAPAPTPQVQQPAASLSVPSSRLSTQHLRGISSRPRASSPLASNSITAPPASPPDTSVAPKLPVSNFFAPPSATSTEEPRKTSGLGIGKPSAESTTTSSAPPNFFGKASTPTPPLSGSTTPFDFGIKTVDNPPPPVVSTSTFGSLAQPAVNGASIGGDKSSSNGFSFSAPPRSDPKPVEATPPSFSFSSTPKPTPAPPTMFSFASNSSPAPAPAATPAPTPAATPFSFGNASKPVETATAAPFSFGGTSKSAAPAPAPAPAPTPATAPAPSPATNGSSPASFSFNAKPAEPAATPSFNFGAPKSTEAAPAFGNAEAASKPAFSFGQSKTTTPVSSPPIASAKPSFGGFNFSSPKPSESKPAAAPTNPFGSSNGAAPAAEAPKPAFSFGAPPASAEVKAPSFSFGSQPPPAEAPRPASPFSFGSTQPAATTTPGFGFGSQPQTNGTPPAFGAAPASTPSFGSTPAPASGFGSTPAPAFGTTAAAPASPFTFGAGNPASAAPANPFGAVASTPTPASPFAFGAATSTPAAPPPNGGGFSFGAPATATAAPAAFGAPAATPSTPAFSFGSPAPTPPAFGFGASTTPQAAPSSAGFTFGSPAPAANDRFGSPGPEGGFSLGMETPAPGSPSGRKIKPLRRGAVKR
ncbi:hypothetical protein P7C73_g2935, partial [Tremellales sp. Uapishka_1]